jgi:mono/diheme cytochrome c family protein
LGHSRRTERAIVCALLLSSTIPAAAGSEKAEPQLAFALHGAALADRDLGWLRRAVAPGLVRVFEPYEAGEVGFRALPFARVLDAVYGEAWRGEEELLFTCRDGYQPTLPVQRVLDHRAWLAFERSDQPYFTIRKRESGEIKTIDLGPFYLVWENLDDAKLLQEADYGWPYQLVGVDLIRSRDRFPRMSPPADATAQVQAGFAAFRVHCSRCHQLFGEGGSIGPELLAAGSPLAYRGRDWLRSWIEEPKRILPTARMPALNPALPDRARTVDEILAYLEAMDAARPDAD